MCITSSKNDHFTSLNEKHITENKCFCKTVKPFLSSKVQSEIKKIAEEDDTLVANGEEVAMNLNDFFSNAVIWKFQGLRILVLYQKTSHPTLNAIVKYWNIGALLQQLHNLLKDAFLLIRSLKKMHSKKSVC